ncbi:MAG: hypothetical protein K8U03_09530 [Planctomycetia bacterium]|nr:hypothetical protein [Planctomycetia bacterium]
MASDPSNVALVRRIHESPVRLVAAATGGGSRLISELLTVPGASQTVLEALVPYALPALVEFLGSTPEQACSSSTARAMAMRCFERARRLRGADDFPVVGLGLSASLASDRPKRGSHRIHLAVQSNRCTWSTSLELEKGARSRDEEEALAAALALESLAEACGIDDRPPLKLAPHERPVHRRTEALPAWIELAEDRLARTDERREFAGRSAAPRAVFPGSFHPLHAGHLRMAEIAAARLGCSVDFEFSIENVEKPPLDFEEMEDRSRQFDSRTRVWFTRAPRMVQKARLFPEATLVCGIDTLLRVADPRFTAGSEAERDRTLAEIEALGCRFLVFGRLCGDRFQTLADLDLPDTLRRICDGIDEPEFRADVSSTELRRSDKC